VSFVRKLQHLLRHSKFRKLFAIRALSQCADGTLQIGMAAHILFNPAQQPDAWSIAAMFAITLLPFSIVGPLVSGLLDHWSRRNVAVVVDATRCVLAVLIAGLVASSAGGPALSTLLFASLMVALALNRFVLAGLAAGMQHTIDEDEFLTASAVMPMIGPMGVLVGGALAGGARLLVPMVSPGASTDLADAVIFCSAAAMWATSCFIATRLAPPDLGPLEPAPRTRLRETLSALADAGLHLRRRPAALLGLATISVQRVCYGRTLVTALLIFRRHLNQPTELGPAMADIGLWMGASGVGFALSVVLVPPLAQRLGMRSTMLALLLASAVVQLGPGSVLSRWPLVVASFLLGWFAQALKICVDTVVQSHVDGQLKGRVFMVYDAVFNAAVVLGAVLGALLLPDDGASHLVLAGIGLAYLAIAAGFWLLGRPLGSSAFNRGTDLAMPGKTRAG